MNQISGFNLELFCEFWMSFVYTNYYRFNLIYNNTTIKQFVIFKCVHIGTEYFQSHVKGSNFYYQQRQKWNAKYAQDVMCQDLGVTSFKIRARHFFLSIILAVDDISNFDEWQLRIFIDFTLRFLGGFFATIPIFYIVYFDNIYFNYQMSQLDKGLIFIIISFVSEIIIFLFFNVYHLFYNRFCRDQDQQMFVLPMFYVLPLFYRRHHKNIFCDCRYLVIALYVVSCYVSAR